MGPTVKPLPENKRPGEERRLERSKRFTMESCSHTFKWPFLVVRDLCCQGVIGMDFITFYSVGIQVNKHSKNILSFLEWPELKIPLVGPNSPNMPLYSEDPRFQGASVFRQRVGKEATAAACQEEVGCESSGRASGRPPDQLTMGSCNSISSKEPGMEGHTLALEARSQGEPRGVDVTSQPVGGGIQATGVATEPGEVKSRWEREDHMWVQRLRGVSLRLRGVTTEPREVKSRQEREGRMWAQQLNTIPS